MATTTTTPELPDLPWGQHYARVTFSRLACTHDYDSPARVARGYAEDAGLSVIAVRMERGTVAVYVREPHANDARAWDRYRQLCCTSAQRI